MKTNRIHTGILKIITRGQFLKPRQAEGITRNTIWELLLPTGCSYFFADRQEGVRTSRRNHWCARRRLSMRNLCGNYAKTMRKQSHTSRPPIAWQFGWLFPWLPGSLVLPHNRIVAPAQASFASRGRIAYRIKFRILYNAEGLHRMAKWAQNGVWVCETYAENMRTVCENVSSPTPAPQPPGKCM